MQQADFITSLFDPAAQPHSATDGLAQWRAQRQALVQHQADKRTLPIGQKVRVEFATGAPLEGVLEFAEELLFWDERAREDFELRLGDATFSSRDILSWVRLD